jgi:hypothetical protein
LVPIPPPPMMRAISSPSKTTYSLKRAHEEDFADQQVDKPRVVRQQVADDAPHFSMRNPRLIRAISDQTNFHVIKDCDQTDHHGMKKQSDEAIPDIVIPSTVNPIYKEYCSLLSYIDYTRFIFPALDDTAPSGFWKSPATKLIYLERDVPKLWYSKVSER